MLLQLIEEIDEASGKKKLEIMQAHPELKELMKWTYDPFKRYYMKSPGIIVDNEDGYRCCSPGGDLFIDCVDLLANLSSRKISGNAAFEEVSDYISILKPDSAELFQRVLDKDLRCGINVSSINKVWPGLIPETEDGGEKPAVYKCVDFDEKWAKFPLLVAPKLDGVRGRFFNGKMYSRQGKVLIGFEHIEKALSKIGNDFDGELMVPRKCFDEASGLIRNKKPTPEARFMMFDIPSHAADKEERNKCLNQLIYENQNTFAYDWIPHQIVKNITELNHYYDWAIRRGHEGIVMYDPDSFYKNGRGHDWMRMVPLKQADCRVTGFFEGKGKFKNSLGGIIVDYKGHECKVGTGFVDTQRIEIWNHQSEFVGKIAQCEFKEETKAGSMRQPRFKRWRFDKTEPNWE